MNPLRRLSHVLQARHRRYRWLRSLPAHVRALMPIPKALEREIDGFNSTLNVLPGGWCPLNKQHILAALILGHQCRRIVEIGVFQGGSLLPMAAAARITSGVVLGIDPYDSAAAEQKDHLDRLAPLIGTDWHERIDWEGLHARVCETITQRGLSPYCRIVRATSSLAAEDIEPGIDLLHIDGNHDEAAVAADIASYVPKVRPGGFVVLDDTHWDGVYSQYEGLRSRMQVFYEAPGTGARPEWAILARTTP
jgi:predicted O-methyltransferase YrrM